MGDGSASGLALTGEALADRQAERAVIAAAMLDTAREGHVLERVGVIVRAEDFYDPRHALVWEVITSLHRRGEVIDLHTLAAALRARDRLHTVGGAQYLGELTDEIPTLAHAESHARIVADLAARRRALSALVLGARRLAAGGSLEVVEADVRGALVASAPVADAALVGTDMVSLCDTILARMEGRERPLATPWPSVSAALGGGLWPGMYVLVGGTGAGKTQWAVQVAVATARAGRKVLYLALELSRTDIAVRVLGDVAGLPWSSLLRGEILPEQFEGVSRACTLVDGLPLHTECGAPYGYGADALAARSWALRPSLVVLDYLQLCAGRAGEDLRVTVGRVSYIARAIARDLGAVVLVLSSTARINYGELVSDPSKDPSDLVGLGKESGEIEYAADGVLVLAHHADRVNRPRARTLVVAKNRHGPLGRVDLEWSGTAFTQAEEASA